MHKKSLRRGAAAFASAVLFSLGLGMTAMSAYAADPASVANINPDTPVSLTVHKYEGPATTACPANGTDQSECLATAGKTKLPGAKFTVTPVLFDPDGAGSAPAAPVDLTTNTGWTQASGFLASWNGTTTLPAGYSLGTASAEVTTSTPDGIAAFTGLSKTLYIVKETAPPPGSNGATYTGATPFAVTLPRATPDGTTWNYDVHVFPKNNKSAITKELIDGGTAGTVSGTTASNTITYVVKTSIEPGYITSVQAGPPTNMSGTVLTYYAVHDTFDTRLTPPAAANVEVKIVGTASTTLVKDLDYTVTVTGQKVDVLFTQTGMDNLVTAKNGDASAQVVTTFPTTLSDANCYVTPTTGQVACGGTIVDGVITNVATYTPNQFPGTDSNGNPVTHPETPSNEVTSHYANLQIKKANDQDPTKALSGAVFELYQITGTTCTQTSLDAELAATPNPTAVKIATSTTDGTGQVTWTSIKTSTWTNGTATTTNHHYCVVETTPPAGYVLPSNPYAYVNLPDNSAGTTITLDITNAEVPPNQLPLTGGAGVAAISGLGLLLVGGGLGYYVVTTRRRREEQDS